MKGQASVLFDVPGPRAKLRNNILTLLTVVGILAVAYFVYVRFDEKGQWSPVLWQHFIEPQTWTDFIIPGLIGTLQAAALGSVFALIFGAVFGLARLSDHWWIRIPAGAVVEFFRAIPLLLLIFGITETPKVLAVAIAVFFVLQINTLAGYKQIDPRVLEAARAYGATGWKGFRYVVLPAAMPAVFTGLRVSAGMSVVVVTAVEFVASESGLGYLIWNSWQLFQPERMYVGLIVVSALGAALTGLLLGLERLLLPWRRSTPGRRRMRKGVR